MRCPICEKENLIVSDSRYSPTSKGWKRKRKCLSCGYAFTAVERYSLAVEEISKVRIDYKEVERREKIARIKGQAKKMKIKLADD